ncbi:MAG: PAS domain-containing protein, partial [Bacteroidota bacterium]
MTDQRKTKSELIQELNSLRDKLASGGNKEGDDKSYEEIVDQAREMIFKVDKDFKFIFFNKYAEKLTGYKNKDLQGKPFAPIVHPKDLNHVIHENQKALNGDSIDYETRIVDASGNTLWLNVQAIPNFDGKELSYILCFAQDITQRKKVEQELTESNRRFR